VPSLQGGEGVSYIGVAKKHEIDEGRRGGEFSIWFFLEGGEVYRGGAPPEVDEETAVSERIKHGVDAADVIVEEKRDRPEAGAARLESFQKREEIMDAALTLPGRT